MSNLSIGLIPSPTASNRRYNREKYYSALKTGFKHADNNNSQPGSAGMRQSFLLPPDLKMDEPLFPILGLDQLSESKTGSGVIIFACWNTMVGSAMVSLPWSFQSSGIVLGLIVSFTSFVISFYTCSLVIMTTKKDSDYIFTLKKYYGKYIGRVFNCFL